MTHAEFENSYGKKVEREYYDNVIEPAYMASSYADKDDFVRGWNTPEHDEVIRNLSKVAEANRNALSGALKLQDDLAYFIADMANLAAKGVNVYSELRKKAVEVLGRQNFLSYSISNCFDLQQEDREDLLKIINK